MRSEGSPERVFVLIRVFNIRTKPELAILLNIWQMHVDGNLSLSSETVHKANFTERPVPFSSRTYAT
jgi:hypothetical protein